MIKFFVFSKFAGSLATLLVGLAILAVVRRMGKKGIKGDKPAGFWIRATCLGTDFAIIDILSAVLAYHSSLRSAGYISLGILVVYFLFFWRRFAATPAMLLAQIKIVGAGQAKIAGWQLIVRFLMCFFLAVGWVTILFDKKEKKALHDIASRTRVVRSY